jgi:outer membrane receptor protein involved in Fe transport
MDRRGIGRWWGAVALAGCLLAGFVGLAGAGTSGKLSGRVTDKKKEPLAGVNVVVVGMRLGAATDADGRYTILNIPPGKIDVKVNLIGYQAVTTQGLMIVSDNTTRLDVELQESALELKEVVVTARRPVVEVNRTSNIATVSREQLQALPVQELQDVVNLQAGVVDGHFRGGRADEVQYQVDGVSVNNAYDNKSSLRLDRSLLEEVQVISGTFDAEYGQAMSGVVNAVLKRGSDTFHWDAEVFSGGPVYSNNGDRLQDYRLRAASQQNFQLTMTGPTKLPGTTFLLSGRRYHNLDWVRGIRVFNPWDRLDSLNFPHPSGDLKDVPLGWSDEWSGVVKLTNRSNPNLEVSWQAILDGSTARNVDWTYRFVPDGTKRQRTFSLVQGLDVTHTLSPTRFYTVSARQNYKHYTDLAFDSVWDPRYDSWGAPLIYADLNYGISFAVQGVDLGRFEQLTNGAIVKASFVDQVAKDHQLKVGGEFQWPQIQFGSPGYLQYYADSAHGGAQTIHRLTEYSAKFPGVVEYRPQIGAAFAQEEIEWNDLTLRAGIRGEYFNANSTYPSDLANPANSIQGVPKSHPVRASAKFTVAPRLGVSYPISKSASLFFAYGHFYQYPGLGQVFENSDYDRLSDLQASDLSIPIMGNPDIRPEKTVQYQFGYKHAIADWLGLDVTTFYKDIRDLLGTEIIETYNGAQYARMANVDFGSVVGFTVTVTQRARGAFSSKFDYTWQSAQGNSSDPQETANRAAAGQDARPRSVPFNWDQRHTFNMTLSLSREKRYNLSAVTRVQSGQPYTPAISTGFSSGLETNSGRKPMSVVVDVRGDRSVPWVGGRVFARVFNVFDTRFDNGFVFETSGDPYYSRFPGKDLGRLGDPTRFFGPRRIEAGITLAAAH